MPIVSTENAEHYSWADRCDGWHLVRSEGLSVIQETMPAATAEVPHYHANARQFFYVLCGSLSITVNGAVHVLGCEQGIEVPPQVPHRVFNDTSSEVRFLVISCPPSQGDRIAVT